ncbi:MAG: alpha-(1-_3)-arabinofuranosyltransferase family protein, partial [Bacteroidales bacterium]
MSTGTYLWSSDSMGYADPIPSYAIYQYTACFLSFAGINIEAIQILFQVFLFMGAGFSMYYLSKTLYPDLKISPLIASIFYMFNFFVLQSRVNVGLAWSYTFLPLLIALIVKAINAAYQHDSKATNRNVIYFAISSTVALSLASINPTNVALIILGITSIFFYYLLKNRKQLKPLFMLIAKIALVTVPINLWWLVPMLNTYVFSPQMLNSQINVVSWSWTQDRSSFLNLFWLNGIWTWLPEYFPYIDSYSNPFMIILVFVPFLLATTALLFKSNKSRFNAYIMLLILFFMFLAKGLHEPFSQLNLLLYQKIPYVNMFREPTSKFTMLIVLLLSLLIGYAANHLSNLKAIKSKYCITKMVIPIVLIATIIIAVFPLVTNPIETKTQQLPFSSYIKIPDYWFQATDWINHQNGDYKVLITPLDDFYQMPYIWGYYGTDQLIERLFQKPVISTDYLNQYYVNPSTAANLQQLRASIQYNNSSEFKAFLDLLNIEYILQR